MREMTWAGPEPTPSLGIASLHLPAFRHRTRSPRDAGRRAGHRRGVALDEALHRAQADAPLVVLDLRALEFIDASAATLILAADRRIRRAGGRLVVVRGGATIHALFALIGLDQKLEFMHRPFAAITEPVAFTQGG